MRFKAYLNQILEEFRSNPERIDELSGALKEFYSEIEDEMLRPEAPRKVEIRGGAQSKQFMIQMMPTIQEYMRTFPKGHQFDILDVGPGAGHGSQLLASMYQSNQLGYRARVFTTDINTHYINYMKIFCRYVNPRQQDIFDMKHSFDIVIASHVIEHVPQWIAFVRQLQNISHGIVVLCAPFQEDENLLTRGHVNIFDERAIRDVGATKVELMTSPAWGQFMNPPYQMFIATLPGRANADTSEAARSAKQP